MAMENIGWPNMLSDFNRRPAKFAVAFGIIREIAGGIPVNSVAIEVAGIVHEKVANAIQQRSIHDGWKSQAISERHSQAWNDCGIGLRSPISRQHHGHFMATCDQGFGKRLDHVGQASGLREWQTFGRRKEDSHNFSRNSCTLLQIPVLRTTGTDHRRRRRLKFSAYSRAQKICKSTEGQAWRGNGWDSISYTMRAGARKLRAPFAFQVTPMNVRSRPKNHIAGSKLAQATAK